MRRIASLAVALCSLCAVTRAQAAPAVRAVAPSSVDRQLLQRAFARAGYRPPAGARLLITRVSPRRSRAAAARAPTYQRFSFADSGVTVGGFWPASTVKLWAAVGALLVARAAGLDSRARVRMRDSYGRYRGTLAALIRPAILWSSNRAYDRLVMVAGADHLNTTLARRYALSGLVIQCPYFGGPSLDSPALRLGSTSLAARPMRARFARCASPQNCASMLLLQEVLRRVVLHDELPPAERFPLAARDVRLLRRVLLRARDKVGRAARAALRTRALRIYNKAGRYPGMDHLDNALIVAADGRRYLVTASVPYSRSARTDRATARQLHELVYRGLLALERRHDSARKKVPPAL
ncbi:MAG: serine hydrolase [Myxococcales bacterium]|nr:serine hydrolase [Myxococcales bacterium]